LISGIDPLATRTDVTTELERRDLLVGTTAVLAGGLLSAAGDLRSARAQATGAEASRQRAAGPDLQPDRFLLGLNTSTIRGQKLSIVDLVAIAAQAGYQAMEPWIDELERYAAMGGSLDDVGKRLRDADISVESAIGFFDWIVDDADRRKKGLEAARRSMELVRRIGGKRLAAPPVGATDQPISDLRMVAERYRALLELGDQMEVVPEVEVWGFSKTLGRLSEAACVAIETGHPKACILPDVYHLYRGGSDFGGIKLLAPSAIHVFHFNDYPAQPPRIQLTDADRVYPGDGVAPLRSLLRELSAGGFGVTLSLELFSRKLWNQDPLTVARTGLDKMKAVIDESVRNPGSP
jgi:2-keto-myo-inositol isomerase